MILKLYLFSLITALIISLGLLILLIFDVNPFQAPFWILVIFYLTLLIFLSSILSIVGFYLKVWVGGREIIFGHLLPTLRQSFIFSLVLVGLLFFQQIKVLGWWVAILFIISLILVEFFFQKKSEQ